ncbi:Extracellular serine protease precursor [Providencia rustigianii]|nr:Extracellular serine protease precursor [Providencia rustigianii]
MMVNLMLIITHIPRKYLLRYPNSLTGILFKLNRQEVCLTPSIWSPAIKQSNGFYQLESAKTRNHILSSSLGSKIAKTWKFDDKLAIKTYVGAAWLHTYGDAQNGGSFQYNTNNPLINNQVDGAKSVIPMIKNGTQLNVGASIPLMENAEMSVNYSGVLSKKYQEHGGTLNIGWHF